MDIQKNKILRDYSKLKNFSKVAKKYGVSAYKVKKIVEQGEDEEQADIFGHMEKNKDAVCNLIDVYLEELLNREKLENTSLSHLASILGLVIDKFSKSSEKKSEGKLESLIEGLKNE